MGREERLTHEDLEGAKRLFALFETKDGELQIRGAPMSPIMVLGLLEAAKNIILRGMFKEAKPEEERRIVVPITAVPNIGGPHGKRKER